MLFLNIESRRTKLKTPLLEYEVHICIGDPVDTRLYLQTTLGYADPNATLPEDRDGCCLKLRDEADGTPLWVVILREKPEVTLVVHELFHLTVQISDHCGIKDEEFRAHLIQWFMEQLV